jgi:integral membrane protein
VTGPAVDPRPPAVSPTLRRPLGGALTRYRVMAVVTGIGLVILTFVAIPLQIWAHNDTMVAIVGTAHGYFYLAYLVTTADLTLRLRWPLWRMLLVAIAGTVPFCSFVAERKVTQRITAEQADSLTS